MVMTFEFKVYGHSHKEIDWDLYDNKTYTVVKENTHVCIVASSKHKAEEKLKQRYPDNDYTFVKSF